MTRLLENILSEDLLAHFAPMRIIEMVNWLYDDHDHMMADGLVEYLLESYVLDKDGTRNVWEYERFKTVWAGLCYAGRRSLLYHAPGSLKARIQECENAVARCFDG